MPTELRHVYRALLRAATYLPDSAARTYTHDTVVKRFRATSDKIRFRSRHGELPKILIDRYHGHKSISSLRRTANKIERAGLGSSDDLKDVLMRAYGRLGRRRRELLSRLMMKEESEIPPDDEALELMINNALHREALRFGPGSKFQVLRNSQMVNQTEVTRKSRRLRDIKIPKENMWGRPTPLKLQASLKRKKFAWTLDRMFPPLPDYEWNRLRDLATGVLPIEEPRPRRPRAGGRGRYEDDESTAELLKYFTTPIEVSKPRLNQVTIDETGVTVWMKDGPELDSRKLHRHSTRYMRRIYASIWNITPKMEQNAVTGDWTATWGFASPLQEGRISVPGPADLELFEGSETAPYASLKVKPKPGRNKKEAVRIIQQALIEEKPELVVKEAGFRIGVLPTIP